MENPQDIVKGLQKIGEDEGFRVICRQTVDYEWGREISNSRINLMPLVVVLPENAQQVACCVKFCTENNVPFRVRSGGHQHEGMCSLDDGVVIRLSKINQIEYVPKESDDDHDKAWIGAGKPLQDVYNELQMSNKTIPGGGCQTVNIGGLTLGGGWGTSVRKMGLTCDNVEAFEMVTAEGKVIDEVRDLGSYSDLFWALRGGGGGNFGIVTRFLFRLSEIGEKVSTFSMQWHKKETQWGESEKAKMVAIVKDYLEQQAGFSIKLTTAMGLRVKHRFMKDYYPIGLAGKFYGPVCKLQEIMDPFLEKHKPSLAKFEETYFPPKDEAGFDTFSSSKKEASHEGAPQLSDLINNLVDVVNLGVPFGELNEAPAVDAAKPVSYQEKPPAVTCSEPWPHKISSGFPRSPDHYSNIAEKAIGIINKANNKECTKSKTEKNKGVNKNNEADEKLTENAARLYMVLHSMPGARGGIEPEDTAFYWRDKDFIVQFQAWWAKPSEKDRHKSAQAYEEEQQKYINWIKEARKELAPDLEGAFINFVDKDIPVEEYYGGNLERLKEIKNTYDKKNVFRFPLSIPPAKD